MKKILLAILLFVSMGSHAQDGRPLTKVEMKNRALSTVENYILKYVDKETYKKYFSLDEHKSYGTFNLPFDNMNTDQLTPAMVEGFRVEMNFNSPLINSGYTFKLDGNFTILENKTFQNDNYTEQFMQSLNHMAKVLDNNAILTTSEVRDWVRQTYPGKRWMHPTLMQNNWPPYDFYYEVFQDNCNPCLSLKVAVDTLQVLKEKSNEMISAPNRRRD